MYTLLRSLPRSTEMITKGLGTMSAAPASYLDRIAAQASGRPRATALVDDGGELAFGELWAEARRTAALLRSSGVEAGDLVAVWMPNSRRWVQVFLAASLLGAATVAVNTSYQSFEVSSLLRRTRATVLVMAVSHRGRSLDGVVRSLDPADLCHLVAVVVDGEGDGDGETTSRDLAASIGRPVRSLSEHAPGLDDPDGPAVQALASRPSVVFTSSGTTGQPKLIVHTQSGLSSHLEHVARAYRMDEADTVVMAPMPFCGVMGLETVLSGLVAGRTVTTLPTFDVAGVVDQIERHGVTTIACSDEALRRVLDHAGAGGMGSLRDVALAVFGGDPAGLIARAREVGFRAFQTYGSSEVHALLCFPPADAPEETFLQGGGYPVSPAYRARATRDGRVLPAGEVGSLEIASPCLFAGYLDDDGLSRTLTADGWFRTGDLGLVRDDGAFVYLSRESDALRLAGFLVEPREIERFLETHPGVEGAQVVGVDHAGRTAVVAFVVGTDEIDTTALRDRCRAELASFKVPAAVVALAEFPTTHGPNGTKVRKVELRTRAQSVLAEIA